MPAPIETPRPARVDRPSPWLGILPFTGVALFLGFSAPILLGARPAGWAHHLLLNGITYMIGWAGIGAGLAHFVVRRHISRSIGFQSNAYEFEVGACNVAFGVAALLARWHSPDYWFAIILFTSLFRIGCGIGHIRSMIVDGNFAINNTTILAVNFGVPAFLLWAYYAWR